MQTLFMYRQIDKLCFKLHHLCIDVGTWNLTCFINDSVFFYTSLLCSVSKIWTLKCVYLVNEKHHYLVYKFSLHILWHRIYVWMLKNILKSTKKTTTFSLTFAAVFVLSITPFLTRFWWAWAWQKENEEKNICSTLKCAMWKLC